MTLPMRRETIDDVLAARNRALTLFGEAYADLEAAMGKLDAARRSVHVATASKGGFAAKSPDFERSYGTILTLPPRATFTEDVRASTDSQIWRHLIATLGVEGLMDRKAKDELRAQLATSPPELTRETLVATLEGLVMDADAIFKRGLAECFSGLDRRFRSHDAFGLGDRIIIDRCFTEYGSWNHARSTRDTLKDVERVFLVLDGRQNDPDHMPIVDAIDEDRRGGGYRAKASETVGAFFKVRVFRNGNAHLWFTRPDLVEKANRLLGEYYDAPLAHERGEAEREGDPLRERSAVPAKDLGWYPTPPETAARTLDMADVRPGLRVLEPSAGEGGLARLLVAAGARVDCIEIDAGRVATLRAQGLYGSVAQGDFLTMAPDPGALYDRVVMNPPFDRDLAIEHANAALDWLTPEGTLTAILPSGAEFRTTRKATAFRAKVEALNGTWRDLPAGSFEDSGTMCNTVVLRVSRAGRTIW